jgi:hypothetical protein
MKIAEVIAARSVWLFDMYELNPRGVSTARLYAALIERYRFMRYPFRPEDFSGTGLQFNDGTFSIGDRSLQVTLQLFNDGLIADTRTSTVDTDAFIEEVLQIGKEQFGLNYHPKLVKTKEYISTLTVVPDFDFDNVCEKMASFCKILSSFHPASQLDQQHLFSVFFKSKPLAAYAFTFERRESNPSIPFSDNKYFSQASLPTDRHIEALEAFEKIMKS